MSPHPAPQICRKAGGGEIAGEIPAVAQGVAWPVIPATHPFPAFPNFEGLLAGVMLGPEEYPFDGYQWSDHPNYAPEGRS